MSLLHSFYCWGSVGVIAGSTLFFAVAGVGNWRILACLWALIPAYNVYNFLSCPIERLVEEGEGMGIRQLMRNRTFWTLCILMVGAGASEIAMAQWASAFAETALGVSKTVGADSISELAKALENAAKNDDREYIAEHNTELKEMLTETAEKIRAII